MSLEYYVYILASQKKGTLYIGVTSNLEKRLEEHKKKIFKGFTEKYNVNILVYYESSNSIEQAIGREKQLKKWKREWKIKLIEESNREWKNLANKYIRACGLAQGAEFTNSPRIREDDTNI